MATEQVGTSGRVYRITRDYKNRDIYNFSQVYTDAYLKPLEERWQYNMRQAELNAAGRKDEYEAKMKIFQEGEKLKSARELARDKSTYRLKEQEYQAQDKANLKQPTAERDAAKQNLDEAKAKTEQVNVPQGARSESYSERESSGTTGGGGGGGYGGLTTSKDFTPQPATQAQIADWNAKGGDASGYEKVGNLAKQVGPQGTIKTQDPLDLENTIGEEANRFAIDLEGQALAAGTTPEDARKNARAMARDTLTDANPALGPVLDAYYARLDKAMQSLGGGGGGGSSQATGMSTSFSVTNPAVQKDKYKDLANIYADLTPEEQQAIKEKMTPAERDDLIKQLEGKTFTNPAGPMPVYEPTDILTEARRLQGKYFGKTVESPGFEQRNRLDELLRMSPEQRAAEIADFQAGRPAPEPVRAPMDMTEPEPPVQIPPTSEPVPPPTPPSTEPPVRIPPNPTPTEEARARPSMTEAELAQRRAELETVLGRRAQDRALVDSMLTQDFSGQVVPTADLVAPGVRPSVPRPVYVPPQTAAPIPSMATRIARSTPVAPSMGARAEGALPPPIRPTMDFTEGAPRLPVYGTPESRAMMQKQNETPGMITAGTDLTIGKAQKAAAEGKGALADEAAGKDKGDLGAAKSPLEQESYYESRINAAMLLKDQPDKLKRLAASGSGRVGLQLYTTNKAKGFPFQSTFSEIVNTFAGDKEAMTKAHDVALATAFAAYDSLNTKA